MSGKWSASPPQIRPGSYFNVENTGNTATSGGRFGIVGLPITANWGPVNEFVTIRDDNELESYFGTDLGASGVTSYCVREALIGGASEVLAYRIVDGDEEIATGTLTDTTGTPRDAITIDAKYAGTRGNGISVTISTNALDASKDDLKVIENGVAVETFTYTKADIPGIVDMINHETAGSNLIEATKLVSSSYVALTQGTITLAGGDSGENSLVTADYTDAMDAFERQGGFDIFSLDGIETSAIVTAMVSWIKAMNDAGHYVMGVIGGVASESVATAVTRTELAATGQCEYIVSLGAFDLTVTLPDGTTAARSSANMAPRMAGIIASCGITTAPTRTVVPGVTLVAPLTKAEIETAITGGVVLFTRRGTDVIVEAGVTSFTNTTATKDETFTRIQSVRAMQKMGTDLDRIIETEWIGKKHNTPTTQQALIATILAYLRTLEAQDVLVNGSTVAVDTRFDNSGTDLYLLIEARFAPELDKVLITLRAPTA